MRYKLGLNLCATSIGWAIKNIDTGDIVNAGVRVFSDGREDKSKKPLNVKKREVRGVRRQHKRTKLRKEILLRYLVDIGLLPTNTQERLKLKNLNPYIDLKDEYGENKNARSKMMPLYALRAKALDEKLELYEIGRILFHLGQRRGFRSNRKDDGESGGKIKEGNIVLSKNMIDYKARTYGEYLYLYRLSHPRDQIRLRNNLDYKGNLKKWIEFPYRNQYKDEFEAIWIKQQSYYPDILTDEHKKEISDILFFQRPLKEVDVGLCRFEPDEKRIAKAHPLFQEFRIRQFINNIRVNDNSISAKQNKILFKALMYPTSSSKQLTYKKIRKILNLKNNDHLNYEYGENFNQTSGIQVNTTELAIIDVCTKENKRNIEVKELLKFLKELEFEEKCKLISVIIRPQDNKEIEDIYRKVKTIDEQDNVIKSYLIDKYNLTQEAVGLLIKAQIEEGYGHLSEKALRNILPYMRDYGDTYDVACEKAGYTNSYVNSKTFDELPYYGAMDFLKTSCIKSIRASAGKTDEERYGKIGNVTVHIVLNQVRFIVNSLIKRYGKPSDIAIEYSKDLSASAEQRVEIRSQQVGNQKKNTQNYYELKERLNRNPSKLEIEKYEVWKSMSEHKGSLLRKCPYTGKPIDIKDLFDGDLIVIDYILPYSRTYDDSINNKVVCFSKARQIKLNQTPYEAFGLNDKSGNVWSKILDNISNLNPERKWRFLPNAMSKFKEDKLPINRLLNDNRYITKVLQNYLQTIMDPNSNQTVQVISGRLISTLRKCMGLNLYNDKSNPYEYRMEYHHYAIDAIVLASVTRDQISNVINELKTLGLKSKLSKPIVEKFDEIVDRVLNGKFNIDVNSIKKLIYNIIVSHKTKLKKLGDKNITIGKLHEDTSYGLKIEKNGLQCKFYSGDKLKDKHIIDYIPKFHNKDDRDFYWDAYKHWFMVQLKQDLVENYTVKNILMQEELSAEENLKKAASKAFEWFVGGNNYKIIIYEIPKNNRIKGVLTKNAGSWESEIISNYDATLRKCRKECISYIPYRWPTAKKVLELAKNDMILIKFSKEEILQLPDDDRVIQQGKLVKEGKLIKGFQAGLRKYLKSRIDQNIDELSVVFRVKKLSVKSIWCIPHDVASEIGISDTSLYLPVSKMKEYNIRKVKISVLGELSDA